MGHWNRIIIYNDKPFFGFTKMTNVYSRIMLTIHVHVTLRSLLEDVYTSVVG